MPWGAAEGVWEEVRAMLLEKIAASSSWGAGDREGRSSVVMREGLGRQRERAVRLAEQAKLAPRGRRR